MGAVQFGPEDNAKIFPKQIANLGALQERQPDWRPNKFDSDLEQSLQQKQHERRLGTSKLMLAKDLQERQKEQEAQLKKELQDARYQLAKAEQTKKEEETKRLQRKQEILDKVEQSGIDYVNFINVAIIGLSGTGKSAFYNAVTGRKLDEKSGLAETTKKPEFRTIPWHSGVDNIRIWDIPGSGTQKFPLETYFEHMSLFCYDFLIIMVGDRFTEWDVAMFKRAKHYGVNTVFVRSKSDQEVNNASEKLFELPFSAL